MNGATSGQRKREITSLSFFVLGVFLSIVFYFPQIRSGFLGEFFLRFFKGLIGPTAFVLPLFCFYIALSFFLDRRQTLKTAGIYAALLSLIVLSAFLQNLTLDFETLKRASAAIERVATNKASATHFLSVLWNYSYESTSRYNFDAHILGGVLGGSLGASFATLFGQIGSLIMLASVFLCLVFFAFNWSFLRLFEELKLRMAPLKNLVQERSLPAYEEETEAPVEPKPLRSYATLNMNEATTVPVQSNAGFSEAEFPLQSFEESQEKETLLTREKRLSEQEAEALKQAQSDYMKERTSFTFSKIQDKIRNLNWWKDSETPAFSEEEGAEEVAVSKEENKTPYAVPQSLKPSRMINPVPIGKVLSTDPTWEKADPLEEELQVKRIGSPFAPNSNLENLSYTEKSLWQPKTMDAGESYGVAQGSYSNLHLASQNEGKLRDNQTTDFSNLARLSQQEKQAQVLPQEQQVPVTESSSFELEPEALEAYYNTPRGTYESEVFDYEEKPPLYKETVIPFETLPEPELELDFKDEGIVEAPQVPNVEAPSYDVEHHDYGSSLNFEQQSTENHWVSVEEKQEKLIPSLKEDFNQGVQKTFQTVEQSLYQKGILKEKTYLFPPLSLLAAEKMNLKVDDVLLKEKAEHLEETLNSFGVKAKVVNVTTGPSITRFEVSPGIGVKVSKIVGLADDIALALAAVSVRIEAPIPGKSAVGIEIPNTETLPVSLRGILESEKFRKSESALTVALGRDIAGEPLLCDLAKMPHLLIAGATGSGKSVCINSILMSLLYKASPDEVKLLLVDPKVVELKIYNDIPHLLAPVVTDPKKAANALNWAVSEMTRRYGLFAEKAVRDLKSYNEQVEDKKEKLPYILLIIDELADLMVTAANEVEDAISRLTAMARAAGIHLIIATQRPSVDVLTGVIKANIPSRIAFSVSSQIDSRTILDGAGAEKLLGKGDMLYAPQTSPKSQRAQGAYVSDREVEAVTQFVKEQDYLEYNPEIAEAIISAESRVKAEQNAASETDGDMAFVPEAIELILETGQASTSILQRRLKLGYPRASRIIDYLESQGYVGPNLGSRPRRLLLTRERWEQIKKEEGR